MDRIDQNVSAMDNVLKLLNKELKVLHPGSSDITINQLTLDNVLPISSPTQNTRIQFNPSEDENKISRPIHFEYNRIPLEQIATHYSASALSLENKGSEYTDEEIIDKCVELLMIIKDQCDFLVGENKDTITITAKDNSLLYVDTLELPVVIV